MRTLWVALALLPACVVAPADDDDVVPDEATPPPPFVLCINELMPDNGSGPVDDAGEWSDWIELHNPTDAPLDLAGLRLSDDLDDRDKAVLTEGTVPPGGFVLLWADDDADDRPGHLSFSLDAAGGALSLFDAWGRGSVIEYGPTGPDVALARDVDCCVDDGCIEARPGGTPGSSNTGTLEDVLVRRGDFWSWTVVPPDDGWRDADFDDSGWTGGSGPLGFGDWHIETTIDPPITMTTWLRADFRMLQGDVVRSLRADLLRDAGAVVHLNGTEVLRSNLPEGPLDPSTRALRAIDGQEEFMYFPFDLDASLLVDGPNQIAVELHRAGPGGDDAGFDLSIVGRR